MKIIVSFVACRGDMKKQTNLSFHFLRKEIQSRQWSSHTGAGICPVVFPEPRKAPWLPRYNFTQIITCGISLNFISKRFRLRAAMFCLMRFYFFSYFRPDKLFPFSIVADFYVCLMHFFHFGSYSVCRTNIDDWNMA